MSSFKNFYLIESDNNLLDILLTKINEAIKPLEKKIEESTRKHWISVFEWVNEATDDDYKKKFAYEIEKYGSIYNSKVYYNSDEYYLRSRCYRNDEKFNKFLEKTVKDNIELNKIKIKKSLDSIFKKLNIVDILDISTSIGPQGIEATIQIKLADDTIKLLDFHSITAGGYNIQILHYSYICSVKG
jgi:hypothetical protein